MQTRLTDILDIEHPVMLAGMGGVSYHQLVTAVSEAGAFGCLGASTMGMEEIAQVTRGRVLPPDDLTGLIATLAELPEPPPEVRRLQLWCHPAVAGLLVGLLGLFWVGRKRQGLV